MIVVVGSLNLDHIVEVQSFPKPGETILAQHALTEPGGKGANQAVAIARAGAAVRMVGNVGPVHAPETRVLVQALEDEGIDTTYLAFGSLMSGAAYVFVTPEGENAIVVASGANGELRPEHLTPQIFTGARVVVLQLEIAPETTARAAELGRAAGATVILNAAPAPESLPPLLVDVLVVNEYEATTLTHCPITTTRSALTAARALLAHAATVVVTLGAQGVVWATAEQQGVQAAFAVEAVDTTAAGDAFVGALARALAQPLALEQAVRFGAAAGALAATRPGTQRSLPKEEEILALMALMERTEVHP